MPDLRPEFWLQLFAYAVMIIVAYFGLRQTVAVLTTRLDSLEEKVDEKTTALEESLKSETAVQNAKIDKLGELFVQSARYEERQANADQHIVLLRKELDEIKHGQGFINGPRLANSGVP